MHTRAWGCAVGGEDKRGWATWGRGAIHLFPRLSVLTLLLLLAGAILTPTALAEPGDDDGGGAPDGQEEEIKQLTTTTVNGVTQQFGKCIGIVVGQIPPIEIYDC